ncbi:hypothetical protein BMJ13_08000 [Staphylococcus saprophyticus]|uniref:hypothetical protein n=1 Tax=Staphylococcus saprophyticus TaxID=29385 RepID=UPI00094BAA23|nr:hypothetical protein [Staphylococcus saprophyticus]OLN92929.1 hypothetical protein BMJ13_08000 [Staphylococcus saprophyticus]
MANYKIAITENESHMSFYDYNIIGSVFDVVDSLEDENRYLKIPLKNEEPLYINKDYIFSIQIQQWFKQAKRG